MCNDPVYRYNKNGLLRPTPCKRCIGCRNDRREDFTTRLQLDYKEYGYIGSFITLTYRTDNLVKLLPLNSAIVGKFFNGKTPEGTLYKKHLTDFMDNLNHKVKKKYNKPIKYVACGEYGDEDKRPHYHAIVLGLPTFERKLVLDTWKKGLISIDPVTHADIRYTLTYMDKQIFGNDYLYESFGDFEPVFGLFSKGLGQLHYKNHTSDYDELGRFYFSPTKYYQLNQYYISKYDKIKSSSRYSDKVLEFARLNKISNLDYADYKYRLLNEENVINKERSKHKVIHNTLSDSSFGFDCPVQFDSKNILDEITEHIL